MNNIDVWGIARSFYNIVFSTGSVTGCTSQGIDDVCMSSDNAPVAGEAYVEDVPASGMVNFGDPTTFVLDSATACSGPNSNIQVSFSLGHHENRLMALNDDGTYSLTINAFHWSAPASFTVHDMVTGQTTTIELYDLPGVIRDENPVDPPDVCQDNDQPIILSGNDISVSPDTTVEAGTVVTLAFPINAITECDNTSDSLEVFFLVNGVLYPASSDGTNYFADISRNQPGTYPYALVVRDIWRGTQAAWPVSPDAAHQITVTDPVDDTDTDGTDETCADMPAYTSSRTPSAADLSQMAQGDQTDFTWVVSPLNNCPAELLTWLSDNISDILYEPVTSYVLENEGTPEQHGVLTLTGQVLPNVTSGAISIDLFDEASDTAVPVNLTIPNINPPQVTYDAPVALTEMNIGVEEVLGALAYTFWVTDPGDLDSSMVSGIERNYTFVPTTPGTHTLHVEILPYTGDPAHMIVIEQAFDVSDTCPMIPADHTTSLFPMISSLAQGSDTELTWTTIDLDSCFGEALTILSHDVEDYLHSPVVSYAAGVLTVTGRALPSVTDGTISVELEDGDGNSIIVPLDLPVIEPFAVSSPADIFVSTPTIFTVPAISGATYYYYWVTQPGDIDDPAMVSMDPSYEYTPSVIGPHILHIEAGTYTGDALSIEHEFEVQE